MIKRFCAVCLLALMVLTSCDHVNVPDGNPNDNIKDTISDTTSSFTLSSAVLQIKVGDIATLEVIGDAANIEWKSSNDSVASVFYGVITAKAVGFANIIASKKGCQVVCQVYVSGTDGSTLRITPAFVSLKKGESYQFQYGNTYNLDLNWTSSAENIVQVNQQGVVTALKPGNATITLSTPVESVTALVAVEHNWSNYSLVWSDEFDGNTLDESVWNIEIGGGGWGNRELQYYTKRTDNIRVQNGCLEIEARKETYENREYTSARIMSRGKKSFLYGKVEARIKFPGGKGTWPAFWMMGEKGGWPSCGEIDIIEHIGSQDTRASFAVHTPEKNGTNGKNWHATHFFDYPLSNDFHVYGVEWCQEEENGKDCIRFFVDGVEYATVWEMLIDDPRSWPFTQAHYIIMNMAIGGNMGGSVDDAIFNQQRIMYVDWVRVYQRQEIE